MKDKGIKDCVDLLRTEGVPLSHFASLRFTWRGTKTAQSRKVVIGLMYRSTT